MRPYDLPVPDHAIDSFQADALQESYLPDPCPDCGGSHDRIDQRLGDCPATNHATWCGLDAGHYGLCRQIEDLAFEGPAQ